MVHLFKRVSSKMSTIRVSFDAGSKAEGKKYSAGIAHMLEHMMFKGTSKRDSIQIARDTGFIGADSNAFTSGEKVEYLINVPFEKTEEAMEILSDIVLNSTFPEEEFLKEREVVMEEYLSYKDDYNNHMYEEFLKGFYSGKSSEMVIGTKESIEGFTVEELRNFYKEFYKPEHCIVTMCSNHKQSDAKLMMEKYFGKPDNKFKLAVKPQKVKHKESVELSLTWPKLEQTHVWITYPGLKFSDPGEASEELLFAILGDGMDSRLFTEVREKRGLCYGIGTFSLPSRDYSSVIISSSTREENLEKMKEVIFDEVRKIKEDLVSEEELERAKNKYRASLYRKTERSGSLSSQLSFRRMYRLKSLDEVSKDVERVTPEMIRDMARVIFDDSKRGIVVCREEE